MHTARVAFSPDQSIVSNGSDYRSPPPDSRGWLPGSHGAAIGCVPRPSPARSLPWSGGSGRSKRLRRVRTHEPTPLHWLHSSRARLIPVTKQIGKIVAHPPALCHTPRPTRSPARVGGGCSHRHVLKIAIRAHEIASPRDATLRCPGSRAYFAYRPASVAARLVASGIMPAV
ncbi:putative Glutamyl-tRNA(Gln) amidotransferase subunit A [Anopheles sinensis]|uniref:Putative Glutamyl-tRNA(Gln) amidotransferase subunit A n=1 Tax=Anopheles sinensis TaxID=74873 RepID=A0A084WS58_ANOSI|nr:putative Glutamyl-tRNA(Gln) amidotransferase subunit A [Anopheles sinensis]